MEDKRLKIGDEVKMINPNPRYGKGLVQVGDIGIIKGIQINNDDENKYIVSFEHANNWTATPKDIEPVGNVIAFKLNEIGASLATSIDFSYPGENKEVLKGTMKDNSLGGKEMKVLDIYESRKKNELREKYDIYCSEVENKDKNKQELEKVQKTLTDFENKINEEKGYKKDNIIFKLDSCSSYFTKETEDKLNKLGKEYENQLIILEKNLEEVKARLELTCSPAEEVEVLKTYGILDKNGKINA